MKFRTLENGNLVIWFDKPDDKELLENAMQQASDLDHGVMDAIIENEGWAGNGELYQVAPELIGALTDSPILTDELIYHDDGTLTVGNIWWFPNYQVESFAETLLAQHEVVFTKVD